ncbi:MAG: uncharacterized protein KVP18_002070 [Porospora cf. gigantea A]|uniref:uncharacterized protein n=1 Tax=Porospora cf. gigantea A TaxID=2853593 RepID=UPI00355A9961|nr:MAG: hypothetical protein KVP18_002070 [Porospora cf. gigantea A]
MVTLVDYDLDSEDSLPALDSEVTGVESGSELDGVQVPPAASHVPPGACHRSSLVLCPAMPQDMRTNINELLNMREKGESINAEIEKLPQFRKPAFNNAIAAKFNIDPFASNLEDHRQDISITYHDLRVRLD